MSFSKKALQMKVVNTSNLRGMVLGLVILIIPHFAFAATFDVSDGDVAGLIDAINMANSSPSEDIINLAPGGTYTLTAVNRDYYYIGPSGLPWVQSRIILNGNGATIQRSTSPGTPEFRILEVNGGDLVLNEITIKGGIAAQGAPGYPGGGGGIRIDGGKVLLRNSTVTENRGSSDLRGAGGNDGGGIFNFVGGTLIIINSTISYNTGFGGRTGGGILNMSTGGYNSQTTIVNSTIFENTADGPPRFQGRGDAIADAYSPPGSIIVKNSVLASPTLGKGRDCSVVNGVMVSLGFNLSSDSTCQLSGPGDINASDPLLGGLSDNGGPTMTNAPTRESPVIDVIPVANCKDENEGPITGDQRGISRPQGLGCDIGSVELKVLTPAEAVDSLISLINDLGLSSGVGNSLTAPLGQASTLLTDGNANNDKGACGKLDAFINQVSTKVQNNQLTQNQADQLLEVVNAIKKDLGC